MNKSWSIPEITDWSTRHDERKSSDLETPYYLQIRDHFAQMIASGSLMPGAKLPTERALAEEFSLNRVTVRRALIRMEAKGMVFREDRRGWFVSHPRVQYDPLANTSFTQSVTAQGRKAGTTVLSQQKIKANEWESECLKNAIGDPIFVIDRIRTVDGRAILFEQILIKAERFPSLFDHPLDQSLTSVMVEKFGIIEHRTQINMRPTALSKIPATALGVSAGTPSLYLSRTILDQYNEAIEFDQEFWRHDAIDISISVAGSAPSQI